MLECAAFKAHMRKVRVKLVEADGGGGLATYKYFGGVERQLDIDVLAFYRPILESIPNLAVVIRKVRDNEHSRTKFQYLWKYLEHSPLQTRPRSR